MKWHEILKKVRQDKGFSLRYVEKQTGLSNPYISQLENGQVKKPSYFKMLTLLAFYEIEIKGLEQPAPEGQLHQACSVTNSELVDAVLEWVKHIDDLAIIQDVKINRLIGEESGDLGTIYKLAVKLR